MMRSPESSAWQASLLTCEVFGGHCTYCGIVLSRRALLPVLDREHQNHSAAVSLWGRILAPEEYFGLELKVPWGLFPDRNQTSSCEVLHLPAIVFQLSCLYCQTQRVATMNELRALRSNHSRHFHLVRLHMVMGNRGRAAMSAFAFLGQTGTRSTKEKSGIELPSDLAHAQVAQLQGLLHTLDCTPFSFQCQQCQSIHFAKGRFEVEDELGRHKHHLSKLQIELVVDGPKEYAGLQLQTRANCLPRSLWAAAQPLRLECLFLEVSRERGGPKMTPWNISVLSAYLQSYHQPQNPCRLLAVVRGAIQSYPLQFRVIRFDRSPQPSEWENVTAAAKEELENRANTF